MNHRPFEEWLLNDRHLVPAEKRDLEAHLRACSYCAALAGTGLELRAARAAAPRAGFVLRFQGRLAAQRIADRRRRLWGLIALIGCGLGMVGWLVLPFIFAVAASPVEWLTSVIGYFLFVITSLQALTEAAGVAVRILPDFIPAYVWMVMISGLAGLGLLWTVSIWRLTRVPQGVSA